MRQLIHSQLTKPKRKRISVTEINHDSTISKASIYRVHCSDQVKSSQDICRLGKLCPRKRFIVFRKREGDIDYLVTKAYGAFRVIKGSMAYEFRFLHSIIIKKKIPILDLSKESWDTE